MGRCFVRECFVSSVVGRGSWGVFVRVCALCFVFCVWSNVSSYVFVCVVWHAPLTMLPRNPTHQVGIASFKTEFGEDVPEEELVAKVQELNNDPKVHGAYLVARCRASV